MISPPAGPNFHVVNGIALDIPPWALLVGSLPGIARMVLAIALPSPFAGIAAWLPGMVMESTR